MKEEQKTIFDTKLAHIAEDGREQTVLNHLTETARLAENFARPFGAQAQAKLAGMAHDIGKYSDAFQKRLRGGAQKTDHSTAGTHACFEMKQYYAAFAVMGHHGGLPDGGDKGDSLQESTFWGRIKRAKNGMLPPYGDWKHEVTLPDAPAPQFERTAGEQSPQPHILSECPNKNSKLNESKNRVSGTYFY